MDKGLELIKRHIEEENVSYGEILYLIEHQEEVKATGDLILCEWADIPEQEII